MIFVDTSAWFALWVASDPNHRTATAFRDTCTDRLLTTDFVVDEVLTLLKARGRARKAIEVCNPLIAGQFAPIARVSDADILAAADMFCQYSDKDWSFTDCTSFVVIRRLGIRRAFAFDQHFQQFGEVEVCP